MYRTQLSLEERNKERKHDDLGKNMPLCIVF